MGNAKALWRGTGNEYSSHAFLFHNTVFAAVGEPVADIYMVMKQKKRIKRVAILCVSCFALLLIVEILLRVCWGFGKMPLYLEDEHYDYIYAPKSLGAGALL